MSRYFEVLLLLKHTILGRSEPYHKFCKLIAKYFKETHAELESSNKLSKGAVKNRLFWNFRTFWDIYIW